MPTTTSPDGARVAYLRRGEGPPVVLVHGVGGDAEAVWTPLIDRLAARFDVVAPQLAGTAATTDDGRALTVERLAGQVLATADAAGARRFDLVAYSLGAPVALELAATVPDRVASLMLLAPWARTDARQAFLFEGLARAFARDRDLAARLATLTAFSPAWFARAGTEGAQQAVDAFAAILAPGTDRQARAAAAVDVAARVAAVAAPALVVGLTHDLQVPVEHARRLAAELPGAEYAEEDSGHALPWERPDRFLALVDDHLAGRHAATAAVR